MPFCYAPWSNIDISPLGVIGPCCKFQHHYYDQPPLNIKNHSIEDYKKTQTLQIIKTDFLEAKWPQGCTRCQIEEEHHISSKRQLDWNRWQQHYLEYDLDREDILTASVAFGNTCNLKCITCGPSSSSKWQREYRALLSQDIKPNHFYKQEFVSDFIKSSPEIIHLDVPGGEPFLSGVSQQKDLLRHIINLDRAQDVSIHYTTNATIWPDKEWWELWKYFKEIDMQISVDGIGPRFEYIRYPAQWDSTLSIIKKYQSQEFNLTNFRISVSHTVSAYNIFYLREFLDWCTQEKLSRPWLGRVHNPAHMRPSVWADSAKQSIIENLNLGNEDARTWAGLIKNLDDSNQFDLFLQRLHWHDRYRGLDFSKTFPEMAKFL